MLLRDLRNDCICGHAGPGPGSSKIGARTTAAIIFGRLCLVPPTGLGIVMLADKLGFLPPGDKMFRFVLLLQHTMPTSVLSGKCSSFVGLSYIYVNTAVQQRVIEQSFSDSQVLLPIYEGVGRRLHLSCSGFTFLLFSQWLVGSFFILTYYFEDIVL